MHHDVAHGGTPRKRTESLHILEPIRTRAAVVFNSGAFQKRRFFFCAGDGLASGSLGFFARGGDLFGRVLDWRDFCADWQFINFGCFLGIRLRSMWGGWAVFVGL